MIKKCKLKIKTLKLILIGLIVLQLLVLGLTMIAGKAKSGGETDSSFPYWLAVFIPIFIAGKKKKSSIDQKKMFWILIALATLVLFAMLFFLLEILD